VTNKFKGFRSDRVSEELWMEVHKILQKAVTSPPLPLWSSLSELSEVPSPGLSPHFPQIKCSLATIASCVSPAFSMSSLVFPIPLLSSISLHCSVKKLFIYLLSILWNSAFRWVNLSFSLLLSLLFFSQLFVRPPLTTISFF